MAKGKMCDREVSFLSQTLERAEENSTAVSWVIAALLTALADSAAALGASGTELSAQDIISVS